MKNQDFSSTQLPAVAGLFYPADARTLQHEVDQFLIQARSDASRDKTPARRLKALIAPHAGYIYSGAVAGAAYARLRAQADEIQRVVVFAPAHRLAFRGMAVSSADQFETPLGTIPVDQDARQGLLDSGAPVQVLDEAFRNEHALEVQLPFLQRMLGEFSLVPILVGAANPEDVRTVMDTLWGGPDTLLVVSSDLSHFYDYQSAERLDSHTTENIEAMQPEAIGYEDACGRIPIQGLLLEAQAKGLRAETVARCNSGDTAGDKQRVVGYGAYVFS